MVQNLFDSSRRREENAKLREENAASTVFWLHTALSFRHPRGPIHFPYRPAYCPQR
jgi:hypothetical protein